MEHHEAGGLVDLASPGGDGGVRVAGAPASINHGDINIPDLLALRPQSARHNPHGRFVLYRIGDAVTSRNIHAAILDAYRLCNAI